MDRDTDLFGCKLKRYTKSDHWIDMPEYEQKQKKEYQKLIVRFESQKDIQDFMDIIGQKITTKTKSIWFPKIDRNKNLGVYYGK